MAQTLLPSYGRTPLILSLIGLILSPFFGVGAVFSALALAFSCARIKKAKLSSLKWSIIISAVTIFICIFYIAALVIALFVYRAKASAPVEAIAAPLFGF